MYSYSFLFWLPVGWALAAALRGGCPQAGCPLWGSANLGAAQHGWLSSPFREPATGVQMPGRSLLARLCA